MSEALGGRQRIKALAQDFDSGLPYLLEAMTDHLTKNDFGVIAVDFTRIQGAIETH